MGVDAGDADGDGRMDLVLTAFAHDRNTLYRNLGDATFEDASLQAGLATATFQRMGWGVAFLDADLDGRQDLFVANGHIFADVGDHPELGERYAQKNQLLLNAGGTTFRDVSGAAGPGLQVEKVSRGLAVGDLDNDGDPDVVVSNMDDTPTLLENRQATGHHWVTLRLTAPTGNRLAIGAHVTVVAGGQTAGPRGAVGRQLHVAGRPARPVRSRHARRAGGRRGAHARRPALGMARPARRSPAYARADAGRTRVARRSPPLMRCRAAGLWPLTHAAHRGAGTGRRACASQEPAQVFSPALTTTEALAPYLAHLEAGNDAFPPSATRRRSRPGSANSARGSKATARHPRCLATCSRRAFEARGCGTRRHPRARGSRSRSGGARRRARPRSMHAPSPSTSGASWTTWARST